jgi:HSP20 family protein
MKEDTNMSLIPWRNKREDEAGRELAPLADFRREMDRLFDNFVREPFGWSTMGNGGLAGFAPSLDVTETDGEVTVRAEVPGVKPEEINISVLGDTLTLSGEKKEESEKKEGNVYHRESRYGSFRRSVQLPGGVDRDNVNADYANGVLTVRLKKSPEAKARKIPIKTLSA